MNEGIVEEVLLPLGQLDFGKGMVAKCDISLWRTRGEHKQLVGEFAFQVQFRGARTWPRSQRAGRGVLPRAAARCERLARTRSHEDRMVYRLKGNPPQSHE